MTDQDTDWAPGAAGPLRVKPGSTVRLPEDFNPGERFGLHKKEDGAQLLRRGKGLLEPNTSGGWPRRTPGVSWSCCRRSTRAARTARSGT